MTIVTETEVVTKKKLGKSLLGRMQRGASAVEYGLILGLIAVAIITVLGLIGTDLNSLYEAVQTALSGATPAP